jgi:hypothetical protein
MSAASFFNNNNSFGNYSNYYKTIGSSKCCNLASAGQTGPTGPQGQIGPTGPSGVTTSDERDKTDIQPLEPSLEFLKKLQPVRFTWNMRLDETMRGQPDVGFIAQNMLKAQQDTGYSIPNLVIDKDPEYLLANYSRLIPTMAQVIQLLDERICVLENKLLNIIASVSTDPI